MLFATMMKQEGNMLAGFLNQILFGLCQSTLDMISGDFISYPEFREGFFKLVHNIIMHCTQGMIELDPQRFQTIIHTVIFAIKHEKPECMEIGLKSLWDLNERISSHPQICSLFFVSFYSQILKEVLMVLTDCRHLSGFKLQCQILQQLLAIVDKESPYPLIHAPIQDSNGQSHSLQSNKDFVRDFLISSIMESFPNLNRVLVDTYTMQLFNNLDDWKRFKGTVRDLMVSMRSFSSANDDFYEHERKVSYSLYFVFSSAQVLYRSREKKPWKGNRRRSSWFQAWTNQNKFPGSRSRSEVPKSSQRTSNEIDRNMETSTIERVRLLFSRCISLCFRLSVWNIHVHKITLYIYIWYIQK